MLIRILIPSIFGGTDIYIRRSAPTRWPGNPPARKTSVASAREERVGRARRQTSGETRKEDQLSAIASAEYQSRRLREGIFKRSIFSDPSWDILLDLFIAGSKGRLVAVKEACLASGAPNTSALRCIQLLQDAGLVARQADPSDGRRQLLALSVEGRSRMECYLRRPL